MEEPVLELSDESESEPEPTFECTIHSAPYVFDVKHYAHRCYLGFYLVMGILIVLNI